jgi:serine/threonine protein kinase
MCTCPLVLKPIARARADASFFAKVENSNSDFEETLNEIASHSVPVYGHVFEALHGSLEEALGTEEYKRTPLFPRLLIIHQMCQLLQAIHHAGYVYLDLKPGNILLRTDITHLDDKSAIKLFVCHSCSIIFYKPIIV